MSSDKGSIGLMADFNIQNLAVLLQKQAGGRAVKCAPFGQTWSLLLDSTAEFWAEQHEAMVVWSAPEQAVPSFRRVLAFQEYSVDDLLAEVDAFVTLLQGIPDSVRTIIVPSWVMSPSERGWGPLDLTNGVGMANALMRMNLKLADASSQNRRLFVVDAQRWVVAVGAGAYSPKMWYLSKTPFHPTVFQEAAKDVLSLLDGVRGRSRKIVILDLDNTLWGGVVGDLGWEKLRLGGHDPIGEAFVDFQRNLKRLINRGITLAVVSKNEEAVALEAINRHPEMVLKSSDLVGWRINWNDKAQNIVDLLSALNLGLDAAVFLDDSPFERGRVREALPDVFVPDLPADVMEYPQFLSQLRCFDAPAVSAEDRNRTQMYVTDRDRAVLRNEAPSLEAWLMVLGLRVVIEPLNKGNLDRATQLFNKTNQINMTTRRLSAMELLSWTTQEGHALWTFRVADKFGDYGLCGIASLVRTGSAGQMLDFLLSCRVIGRGVEDAMVATVLRHARENGCDTVFAEHVPSAKNEPCRKWLASLPAFDSTSNRAVFTLDAETRFPVHIEIVHAKVDEKVCS
jgi:FkbH-like protein